MKGPCDSSNDHPSKNAILFVHVGVSAGRSFAHMFTGDFRSGRLWQIHVNPVLPIALWHHAPKLVVVALRDPLSRFVSALRLYPTSLPLIAATLQECPLPPAGAHWLDHLGRFGMLSPSSNCSRLAVLFRLKSELEHFDARGHGTGGHLEMGLCFYVMGVVEQLLRIGVWTIRTESFAADTAGLAAFVRPPLVVSHSETTGATQNMSSNAGADREAIKAFQVAAYPTFRAFLDGEYVLSNQLMRSSINMRNNASVLYV